jgi:ribonucleoside-diphosphate reductase alpha chain
MNLSFPEIAREVPLSQNALVVLKKRYLKKDDEGNLDEGIGDMFLRVAETIAQVDLLHDPEADVAATTRKFYELMTGLYFLPNSPTLMNAGRELGQLSACFVLPVDDSIESIFDAVKQTAIIHKCLPAGSQISTIDGPKAIETLKPGDVVFDRHGKPRKLLELIPTGRQQVCEVTARRGSTFKCTQEHQFLTVSNLAREGNYFTRHSVLSFKKLADFDVNTGIVFAQPPRVDGEDVDIEWNYQYRGNKANGHFAPVQPTIPTVLDTDLAWLLGYFVGDGSYHQDGIRFHMDSLNHAELKKTTTEAIQRIFGLKPSVRPSDATRDEVALYNVQVKEFFQHLIGDDKHAVPRLLYRAKPEVKWAFISGLFDADGNIKSTGHISIATSYENLRNQLVVLLNMVGVYCGWTRVKTKTRDAYQVRPLGREGVEQFMENLKLRCLSKEWRLKPNYLADHGLGYYRAFTFTKIKKIRELPEPDECYNITVEDVHEYTAMQFVSKNSGGGTGFSFSRIRPSNDPVMSTKGVASGPISFMNIFDVATETIKQGGTRRGANMAILRVDHPDIEAFITCKNDTKRLTNFNISVGLTDAFMEAVKSEADFPLINPRTGEELKKVNAAQVFDLIVQSAWSTGEPGIIFLDAINRKNPLPHVGEIESTNPCGEQPLLPYESCNLGSLNLAKAVTGGQINYQRLAEMVQIAVHFLDNVIDANRLPLPQIKEQTLANRKIGLGVMGFADMLLKMGIPYNSEEAVEVAEEVMAVIQQESKKASAVLANRRGNFPNYQGSVYDGNAHLGLMRNATTTTIAPTGTISIIAGVSSGIEPVFALSFVRRVLEGEELVEVHPYFEELAKSGGFYSPELMKRIAETGSIRDFQEIPQDVRRLFVTSHDISPLWHLRLQAAFQKYTDNAVSKTVNFSKQATVEDVRAVYLQAFELGLKGVTIYRDGSRDQQVLSFGKDKPELQYIAPRPRPERTTGVTEYIKTGCGKLYVTVNKDDLGFCEVFAQMGKTGGCASSQIESAGRLISLALRSGVKIEAIIKQLSGLRCPSPCWNGGGKQVLSCPDAIAKVLSHVAEVDSPAPVLTTMEACPDCGGVMEQEGGCAVCRGCGFSKC